MSEATFDKGVNGAHPHRWASEEAMKRVRKRYRRDRWIQIVGLSAIGISILMLGTLLVSIVITGIPSFTQSMVTLEVTLDPVKFDREHPQRGNYRKAVNDAFRSYFPEVTSRSEQRQLYQILSPQAHYVLRDMVVADPSLIGRKVTALMPLSDPFDQLHKGVIPSHIPELSRSQVRALDYARDSGLIRVKDGRAVLDLSIYLDPTFIDAADPGPADYDRLVADSLRELFSGQDDFDYQPILGDAAVEVLKAYVIANPGAVGRQVTVALPLAPAFDKLFRTGKAEIINPRIGSEKVLDWYRSLVERGLITTPFNWALLFNADSRFPEIAGLAGAIAGSFLALLVCFLISFPIGIAAAIYLEEFAAKNRWTDLIEVNINNLAAVPSVVFGLLGLAVFIGFFGLPRSAPLVGGMVLSLMTLPTIIIATRAALKAVPPSIREAALGVGASRHQVVMHHVLPLAMPGILTGTIIGLAQALGETAPLLLIGMNAFIPSIENLGLLEPATSLPTQIYSWADSPERGFVARTSAAILVLLGFLVVMNGIAIYLRQRFEKRW